MKNSVLDNFPLGPPCPPPLKSANFIFIVVSLSLIALTSEIRRSPGGRVAQIHNLRAKFAPKLAVFRFAHQRKGAQHCRKFLANLKVNFGQFYANTPFAAPPSPNFCLERPGTLRSGNARKMGKNYNIPLPEKMGKIAPKKQEKYSEKFEDFRPRGFPGPAER